jgi:hypothetical protein
MDIGSGKVGPAGGPSNFRPRPFIFDDVECASMEGLLQSFKLDKTHMQAFVCTQVGRSAKKRGSKRNKAWKSKQRLWWKGVSYERGSQEYQDLLDRAFLAMATQNKGFQRALLGSDKAVLKHSMGKSSKRDTVLTESEFCSRLTKMRAMLHDGKIKIIE